MHAAALISTKDKRANILAFVGLMSSVPLKALGEIPFLVSSSIWWLQVFLGIWLHHANLCLCGHRASLSSVCLSLSFIRTLVAAFKAHLDNPGLFPHLEILHWIAPAKTLFPNVTFTVPEI